MKIFKNICLLSFLIVTILFTVGWATQPIIETSSIFINNANINANINANANTNQEENVKNQITINDLKSGNIQKALFYLSITTTLLLGIGILIGFLGIIGFVFISKIIFFIAMLLMIFVFLIIQINIISGDVINIFKELINNKTTNGNISVSNGNAYYMILTSMCLMVVTYIVYVFLA
jgi:hypothetical protein